MIDLTCAHHEHHETRTVHVNLGGQPAVPDYPPIPDRLALEFDLDIWDADRYDNTEGYCTGDDMVSRSIAQQGIWEGFETLLVLDILNRYEGTVVDIGCQLGWYSTLAVLTDHPVHAIDGDYECVQLAVFNANRAGEWSRARPNVRAQQMTFDGEPLSVSLQPDPILLLKADIEGQELAALRTFGHKFEAHEVQFAIVEVTPSWGLDEALAVVSQMRYWGYQAYAIPDKGYERVDEFVSDPLAETLRSCRIPTLDAGMYLSTVDQTNILFARPA